ncbi:class I SAM-dependent methyltransferase [Oscillatoriales cyanobacterium LEGE 11467]|uniref:Class I SAM-dependent methyltransferase n=1 Tax=Zarconia navalis LEGE 11467 TaxID=1828826 RepID=A0A928Z8A0_9CYAN|nr:class I SAM-dependent methyltransferase [Zarconia navalis]MBE9042262.1 class I SAM-dependent methyltransferase [Zarconia navalis LEGE 11467]
MIKPGDVPQYFASHASDDWQSQISQLAYRFNREYRGESFKLPEEVESMPIFRDWATGKLQSRIASPFWELAKPKKNQHCLDIGCGVSFLIYPWWEWNAFFYGQEVSSIAKEALQSRAPQLNSKLFKGVEMGAAHQLEYEADRFDLAIATGFSCYFSRDYWSTVMEQVQRVLKPGGQFVFDILNPEAPLAEDWAILETYLGTEVYLDSIADWEATMKAAGIKKKSSKPGELFIMYKVQW